MSGLSVDLSDASAKTPFKRTAAGRNTKAVGGIEPTSQKYLVFVRDGSARARACVRARVRVDGRPPGIELQRVR